MAIHSCLYEGTVRHRRFAPRRREFSYRLFLCYFDLEELPTLFEGRWFWSASRPNLAWFRREDYLAPTDQPLTEVVRDLVSTRLGKRPTGAIRLLTHPRYWGFAMNPISLYYCFDPEEQLEAVVAEVTNTPWGERHCYVIDARNVGPGAIEAVVEKQLHVSPFLKMAFDYHFLLTTPKAGLTAHIAALTRDAARAEPMLDATLQLRRVALTGAQMARVLCVYPAMTLWVFCLIYYQAWRLWWEGVPFVAHPRRQTSVEASAATTPEPNPDIPKSQRQTVSNSR